MAARRTTGTSASLRPDAVLTSRRRLGTLSTLSRDSAAPSRSAGGMIVSAVPALPTVSVVIPTRSRPHDVVRAVKSVLDQTAPPAEVIVVIDGPDPATSAALDGVKDER